MKYRSYWIESLEHCQCLKVNDMAYAMQCNFESQGTLIAANISTALQWVVMECILLYGITYTLSLHSVI